MPKKKKAERAIDEFYIYKRNAIRAANELAYRPTIVDRVREAKTINEITRIMKTARLRTNYMDYNRTP